MANYAVLKKEDFNDFIASLAKRQKLVAPVHKGYNNFAFEEVTSGEEVSLDYIPTILPPKKYFMPQTEAIQEFNKKEQQWN